MERIPIAMGGGVAVKHAFKLVTRLFKTRVRWSKASGNAWVKW